MTHRTVFAVTIAVFALGATPISAQTSGTDRATQTTTASGRYWAAPQTYGTAMPTSYVVGAYEFDPFNTSNTTIVAMPGTGDRYVTTGGSSLLAALHIPNGAVITGIEIQGCDSSAGGEVSVRLFSNTTLSGVQSQIDHGGVGTGGAAAVGCDFFGDNFVTPVTVDNFTRTYYLSLTTGTTDNTNRFSAVRLFYFLQVSPSPAQATFADVPLSNPFNRFVEALVAAGITGGCGGGNYCPDSPVTRGQMAVFLATALGLHFPL